MTTTKVIEIDVNDGPMRRFLELWNKFEGGVKSLPKAWAEAGKAMDAGGEGFAAKTEAIKEQSAALDEQAKKQAKANKDAETAQDKSNAKKRESGKIERENAKAKAQEDRRHEKSLEAQKKTHDQIKRTVDDTGKGIVRAGANLAKWVAFGGLGGLLAGAGTMWGLGAFAGSIGDAYRESQGIGTSTGSMQAFRVNFNRYVDESNLSTIADAQGDLSKRWVFSAMGINPVGKDPAQLAMESALRARDIFIRGGKTQQYAEGFGLTQLYSMEELRRLANTPRDELMAAQRNVGRDAGKFEISDRAQQGWQAFRANLDAAGFQIKNVFGEQLQDLAGPLEGLTDAFADTVKTFLESGKLREWIIGFGEGIREVGAYIGSDKFQSDVKSFVTNFALVCEKIVEGLRLLGWIKPEAGDKLPNGNTSTGDLGTDIRNVDVWGGRKPLTPSEKEEVRAAQIMGVLGASGWDRGDQAAIASNLFMESGFNPFAKGDKINGVYTAYGLAQWRGSRQNDYAKMFGHTMQSVTDPAQAVREQLAFLIWELTQGNYKKVGDRMRDEQDAYRSSRIFTDQYERPKDPLGIKSDVRGRYAQKYLNIEINNNTGGSAAVQTSQLGTGG